MTLPHHTRIAPSPTGMMHVGTARTALFSYLAARASGGKFIMRLDDTDLERNQPEAIQPIYDGLAWLGLEYDASYRQSERSQFYADMANILLDAGLATKADNGAILLKPPADLPRTWTDQLVGTIPVTDRDMEMINGLVLVRGGDKIGQPLYHFTSIADDYAMGITSIIRGDDHRSNTAKQIAIWHSLNTAFGHEKAISLPRFYHVGLIFKDKKKMSKRDGAASLLDYRDKGYEPDALFNFLLRLGWGPKRDDKSTALISRERALELFLEGGNMSPRPSNFDSVKLESFQRKYRAMKTPSPSVKSVA